LVTGEKKRLEIIRSLIPIDCELRPELAEIVRLRAGVSENDDCAVYELPGGMSLVVGMDFVRGTEFWLFQAGLLSFVDIGYYLIVANLSDVAAMGATPIGLTTVIRYPSTLSDDEFTDIVRGISMAASEYQAPIVGGDIGGYDQVVLAATALGIVPSGDCMLRTGAKNGDSLCVTGPLGLPSTAVAYYTLARPAGMVLAQEDEILLLDSWRRPKAHIAAGISLARSHTIHACQDVSDGAKATIHQLAQASGLSFEVLETNLPIHEVTHKVASFLGLDPVALAFTSSVDFQLMFTVASSDVAIVRRALVNNSVCQLHVIGHATSEGTESTMVRLDGRKVLIPGQVWNQQQGDPNDIFLGDNGEER
jgi:thiamine-monophosphate kinase